MYYPVNMTQLLVSHGHANKLLPIHIPIVMDENQKLSIYAMLITFCINISSKFWNTANKMLKWLYYNECNIRWNWKQSGLCMKRVSNCWRYYCSDTSISVDEYWQDFIQFVFQVTPVTQSWCPDVPDNRQNKTESMKKVFKKFRKCLIMAKISFKLYYNVMYGTRNKILLNV